MVSSQPVVDEVVLPFHYSWRAQVKWDVQSNMSTSELLSAHRTGIVTVCPTGDMHYI